MAEEQAGDSVAEAELVRLRAALAEARAETRRLLDCSPQVGWTADAAGQILSVSQRWLDLTGLSNEEAMNDGWMTVIHPEDLARTSAAWSNALRLGHELDFEHRIRTVGAGYRWFRTRATPWRAPDGRIQTWYGATEDIDDRRRAKAQLRASEERLRVALDAAALGTWEWDMVRDERRWDAHAAALYGRVGATVLRGQDAFLRCIHPEDRPRVEAVIARARDPASSRPFEIDYRVAPDLSPKPRWVMSNGRCFFENGVPVRMIGTLRDVTADRMAAAALRESEARVRLAQEAAGVGIWELDVATGISRLSPTSLAMHGLPPGDGRIAHTEWARLLMPEHRDEAIARVQSCIEEGTLYDYVFCVTPPDGEVRWIHGLGRAEYDEAGRPLRIIGLNVDVTRRIQAEAELQRAQEDLSRVARLTAMGALASTLAHEINQPLTAIANFLSLATRLAEGEGAPAELAAVLSRASGQTQRVGEIIRRIRRFAVAGEVRREWIALRPLLEQAWAAVRPRSSARWISFTLECDPAIGCAGDPVQIEQVVCNLLRNALEAMAGQAEERLAVRVSEGERIEIRIADNGPGLDPATRAHLFEPFRTTKANGTGLGLSICRTIVETHGGEIGFADPDQGCEVVVALPREVAARAA